MSAGVRALVKSVSDWRINTQDSLQSITFPGQQKVTEHLRPHAEIMAENIRQYTSQHGDNSSFLLEFGGWRYRIQRIRSNLFAARKIEQEVSRLDELGFRKEYTDILTSDELQRTGGLVIIFGGAGAGKTTTASATVAARLEKLGGYCLCVEDPPEMQLEGFYGTSGYCEQMDATSIGYEKALIEALRCFPSGKQSMLMLGEIRSNSDAYELIQVALDGHLVITTMHARDLISGLIRLTSKAGVTGEKEVRSMLASSLTLAIHQSLTNNVPQMQMLRFNATSSSIILNGSAHHLQDEILKQNKIPERKSTTSFRQN